MMELSIISCECGRTLRFQSNETKYFACPTCARLHWRFEAEQIGPGLENRPLQINEKLVLGHSYSIAKKSLQILGLEQYECTNGFYSLWIALDVSGELYYILETEGELMLMTYQISPPDLHMFQMLSGGLDFTLDEEKWIVSEVDRLVMQRLSGEVVNDFRNRENVFIVQASGKGQAALWVIIIDSKHCKVFKGEYDTVKAMAQ